MNISLLEQIKLKFKNGAVCPYCGSKEVNKFGFFNGKQRFRCKDCRRTFNLYTKTLLSWSHYKDKWGSFIETMAEDMSLRQAEQIIGVSYSSLFYWRHKVMTILNEDNGEKFHGLLELMSIKFNYLDKFRNKKEEDDDTEDEAQNVIFAFLYQRDNRLEPYIYKESNGLRPFIYGLSENIEERSIVCLNSSYPYRLHLLYKKVTVADKKKYKRDNYFNADNVKKYLRQFRNWTKMFRGISSKNLPKYAAFFRSHKLYNNMECIVLSSLREYEYLRNQNAAEGVFGF